MPEELASQLSLINDYLDVMGITHYRQAGYEADDIIGTFSKNEGYEIHIYSSDKDLLQLVNDNVTVHLLKKGMKEVHDFTPEKLLEVYELTHHQMIDLKALMGDPSDNIPGVPGVGEKTAIKLLKQYGSVDAVLEHAHEIKGKLGEKIQENVELAKLSKELVTIDTKAILDISFDDVKRSVVDQQARVHFLQRYELHMLARDVEVKSTASNWSFDRIDSDEQLLPYLVDEAAIYLELSDINYHRADLWGIGIATSKGQAYISPEFATTSLAFKTFLEDANKRKWTYDAKALLVYMKWQGIEVQGIDFDLLLSAYIINAHLGKEEFKRIVSAFHYDDVEYEEKIYGKGAKKGIPNDNSHHKHIASKARAILLLKHDQIDALKKEEQYDLYYQVELPLSDVLADMEYQGIHVDESVLNELGNDFKKRLTQLEETIIHFAGRPFNIASPKQLGEVLFDELALPHAKKTKTGYSTNAEVLNKLKKHHPIIEHILNYRTLSKLNSTYVEGLIPHIMEDGKIHTIYMQALTTTGRLSSVEPNLQNIPIRTEEGRLIRKVFKASENRLLVGSDYSQIELRVLAHIAEVMPLIQAFNEGADIHEQTAKQVFNIEEVTSEQRRAAKAVNFGIIYGISAWSLADDIHVSQKEAQSFIDTYLTIYPEIKGYMDSTVAFAKQHGYVETILKRRRYIPELQSSVFMQRAFGERTAMNAPIQGSAADILKVAMIDLHKALKEKGLKSKMILQVHDELILDVFEDELEVVKTLMNEKMRDAYPMKVSLKTSLDVGRSWYEVK
jgi:DNA polymerase-1